MNKTGSQIRVALQEEEEEEEEGKREPIVVNYEREERCMVGLAGVVDFAGDERHEQMAATTWKYLFVCSQWSSENEKRSIAVRYAFNDIRKTLDNGTVVMVYKSESNQHQS